MNRFISILKKTTRTLGALRARLGAIAANIVRRFSSPRDRADLIASITGLTGSFLTIAATITVMVYTTRPDRSATGASAVEALPKDPVALGKKLFVDRGCVACHQFTGMGLPGQFPPLARSEWVQGAPERPIRILLNGLQGPTQIHGQTYNNAMPAFGAALGDNEIAALLTYIRQEWGNRAAPVDSAEVAAVRAATKARTIPWTSAELESALAAESEGKSPSPSVESKTKDGDLAVESKGDTLNTTDPAIERKGSIGRPDANKPIDPKP